MLTGSLDLSELVVFATSDAVFPLWCGLRCSEKSRKDLLEQSCCVSGIAKPCLTLYRMHSTSVLSRRVCGIFSQPHLSTLCFSLRPNLHQSESKKRQTQFYNSPERPKGNCEKAQGRG